MTAAALPTPRCFRIEKRFSSPFGGPEEVPVGRKLQIAVTFRRDREGPADPLTIHNGEMALGLWKVCQVPCSRERVLRAAREGLITQTRPRQRVSVHRESPARRDRTRRLEYCCRAQRRYARSGRNERRSPRGSGSCAHQWIEDWTTMFPESRPEPTALLPGHGAEPTSSKTSPIASSMLSPGKKRRAQARLGLRSIKVDDTGQYMYENPDTKIISACSVRAWPPTLDCGSTGPTR